jgi:hypothetical protein
MEYMKQKKTTKLIELISERFSDVWKLLSETSLFLSRTKEQDNYDKQLRQWRSELQSSRNNPEVVQRIRSEVIELRKNLRLQGYDLSLGRQNLVLDGFRNDACMAEGFTRVVIFITNTGLYYIAGDDNHIALAEYLERRLMTEGALTAQNRVIDRHYLWYLRQGPNLILSGSDTEGKEDFERLKAVADANVFLLLSGLKRLK